MAKRVKKPFKHAARTKPAKPKRARKPRQPSLLSRWIQSVSPESRRAVAVGVMWVVVVVAISGGAAWGLQQAERRVFGPQLNGQVVGCPEVILVDAPAWMPAMVVGRLREQCRPYDLGFYDERLVAEVRRRAAASPWVRRVNVVRKRLASDGQSGAIELSCEYRRPVARVLLDDRFGRQSQREAYVDAEGVRLPFGDVPKYLARFTSMEGAFEERTYASSDGPPPHASVFTIHYPIIYGVTSAPPANGEAWLGDDLAAGMRLFGLISSRPYADEITGIDVRNFDGRLDPAGAHLRMSAQVGQGRLTTIVFGKFPMPGGGDYVISPQRKLEYLDWYTQQSGGRLAGLNEQLDLRYDQLHVSLN